MVFKIVEFCDGVAMGKEVGMFNRGYRAVRSYFYDLLGSIRESNWLPVGTVPRGLFLAYQSQAGHIGVRSPLFLMTARNLEQEKMIEKAVAAHNARVTAYNNNTGQGNIAKAYPEEYLVLLAKDHALVPSAMAEYIKKMERNLALQEPVNITVAGIGSRRYGLIKQLRDDESL